jgi:hypothetical protein
MSQRDKILTELKELGSSLSGFSLINTYQAPAGYFEGFSSGMLDLVKAMDAKDAREELSLLSSLVNDIDRSMPFSIPAGYFEGLEKKLMAGVLASETEQSFDKELETLSPLLSGLKKEVPYSVPDNYFDSLVNIAKNNEPRKEAKIISIGVRKWYRVAAAAAVTGIIAISAFLFTRKDAIDPVTKSHAWIEKSLNQVSTDDLDQFIDMSDEQLPVIASVTPGKEAKELVNNLSVDQIGKFLDELNDTGADIDSEDDILLN